MSCLKRCGQASQITHLCIWRASPALWVGWGTAPRCWMSTGSPCCSGMPQYPAHSPQTGGGQKGECMRELLPVWGSVSAQWHILKVRKQKEFYYLLDNLFDFIHYESGLRRKSKNTARVVQRVKRYVHHHWVLKVGEWNLPLKNSDTWAWGGLATGKL